MKGDASVLRWSPCPHVPSWIYIRFALLGPLDGPIGTAARKRFH
jgi:hypothetical protein